jgi:ElaB/YqjD/DUF883 family membrane-anchored ribosome-binding protein
MTNHKIEQALSIIRRAEIATKSVDWWEKNVIELMDKLDKALESGSEKEQRKIPKLRKQLFSFVKRAEMEMQNICDVENEIAKFIANEKATQKDKKTAKKPGKKGV